MAQEISVDDFLDVNKNKINDFIKNREICESIQNLNILKNKDIREWKESETTDESYIGSKYDHRDNDTTQKFISKFQPNTINSAGMKTKSLILSGEKIFLQDKGFYYSQEANIEGENEGLFKKIMSINPLSKKKRKTNYVSNKKLDAFLDKIKFNPFIERLFDKIFYYGSMVSIDFPNDESGNKAFYPTRYIPLYMIENAHGYQPDLILFYDNGFIKYNELKNNDITNKEDEEDETNANENYLVVLDIGNVLNQNQDNKIKFFYQKSNNEDFTFTRNNWQEGFTQDLSVFEFKIEFDLNSGYGVPFFKNSFYEILKGTHANYMLYKKLYEQTKTILVIGELDKSNSYVRNNYSNEIQVERVPSIDVVKNSFIQSDLLVLEQEGDDKSKTRFIEQDTDILSKVTDLQQKIEGDILCGIGFPKDYLSSKNTPYNISTATSVMANPEYVRVDYIKKKIEENVTFYINNILKTKKVNERVAFTIQGVDVYSAVIKDMKNYEKKEVG